MIKKETNLGQKDSSLFKKEINLSRKESKLIKKEYKLNLLSGGGYFRSGGEYFLTDRFKIVRSYTQDYTLKPPRFVLGIYIRILNSM